MICISHQSTRNSSLGRSGASRMPLRRRSMNWNLFLSSRQQRNWGSFWRLGSRSPSSTRRCPPDRIHDDGPFTKQKLAQYELLVGNVKTCKDDLDKIR